MKKRFSFFFAFSKQQRKGVLALFLLLVFIQAGFYITSAINTSEVTIDKEAERWLALQSVIDSLKSAAAKERFELKPFNPNFISDYKGYTLGMTPEQIARLEKYRKTGKFINSAEEFRQVTKVSDSVLSRISPYFKFPDWVNNKSNGTSRTILKTQAQKISPAKMFADINKATESDLIKIYGIGPVFSQMIIKQREILGGFVTMEQMDFFDKFSPEAKQGLKKVFKVLEPPVVNKINVNTAGLKQLIKFPYFDYELSKKIITHRSMSGKITKIEELLQINGFPVDKVDVIALYLDF